jgi:hypothetical protein
MIQFDFFFINPTVSEANMVDTCKHFEIGSGSVRSLSHLPVFVIGVPSARRFYFFIRSVRAFVTTQSLLFISFTKPSMTTLPSSSSKVKPCFLFE